MAERKVTYSNLKVERDEYNLSVDKIDEKITVEMDGWSINYDAVKQLLSDLDWLQAEGHVKDITRYDIEFE